MATGSQSEIVASVRPSAVRDSAGFTLLEMMVVVSIVGILTTLAIPNYVATVVKAREAALKQGLFLLRDVIDQYRADRGKYPQALTDLTTVGYLRSLPTDPFTQSTSTWQEIPDQAEGGIFDVHSGSTLVSVSDGKPYNE
ncbi:MAG TPA: prepilin-type N-terminal cleavage/methylation domain-containing protein, partial [Nitrospiraceae bacterium]|nr:prepilin-type N-terminal cleavage/methylation domain-containing protein [Nitrospiraceae bacterium]